ncbi:MAG: 2-oxoacid:ferredoxin oxidoreductase subunit beta, partial [Nitrososphaeraceae archaeon]
DSKMSNAILKSYEWGKRIPIGVFYQNEMVATYEERIASKIPDYAKNPPSSQRVSLTDGRSNSDISNLLDILRVSS